MGVRESVWAQVHGCALRDACVLRACRTSPPPPAGGSSTTCSCGPSGCCSAASLRWWSRGSLRVGACGSRVAQCAACSCSCFAACCLPALLAGPHSLLPPCRSARSSLPHQRGRTTRWLPAPHLTGTLANAAGSSTSEWARRGRQAPLEAPWRDSIAPRVAAPLAARAHHEQQQQTHRTEAVDARRVACVLGTRVRACACSRRECAFCACSRRERPAMALIMNIQGSNGSSSHPAHASTQASQARVTALLMRPRPSAAGPCVPWAPPHPLLPPPPC